MKYFPHESFFESSSAVIDAIKESALAATDKKEFTQLVAGFPAALFYRYDATSLAAKEEKEKVSLPAWYREINLVLAGMHLGEGPYCEFRFSAFDNSESYDYKDTEFWGLGWWGLNNDEDSRKMIVADCQLLPIAGVGDDDDMLAISLKNPGDKTIYRFYRQDMWDNIYDELDPMDAVRPCFSSYASLVQKIGAARPWTEATAKDRPVVLRQITQMFF